MPYIKQMHRPILDRIVDGMHDASLHVRPGHLNYLLFKFATELNPSYENYRNYIGELNECIAEIRRRLMAKYENEKIKENGDVI